MSGEGADCGMRFGIYIRGVRSERGAEKVATQVLARSREFSMERAIDAYEELLTKP
jgi:hypothetical protein